MTTFWPIFIASTHGAQGTPGTRTRFDLGAEIDRGQQKAAAKRVVRK